MDARTLCGLLREFHETDARSRALVRRLEVHALRANAFRTAIAPPAARSINGYWAIHLTGAPQVSELLRPTALSRPVHAKLLVATGVRQRPTGHSSAEMDSPERLLAESEVFSPGIHTQVQGPVGVAGQGFSESSATSGATPRCQLQRVDPRYFSGIR